MRYNLLCWDIISLVRYNHGSVRNIFGSVTAWPGKAVLGTCHQEDQPNLPLRDKGEIPLLSYLILCIWSDQRSWCYMYDSSFCSLTIKDHGLSVSLPSYLRLRSHTKNNSSWDLEFSMMRPFTEIDIFIGFAKVVSEEGKRNFKVARPHYYWKKGCLQRSENTQKFTPYSSSSPVSAQ